MGQSTVELSIAELRQRYLEPDTSVSAQLLANLSRDPRKGARRLHTQLKKRLEAEKAEQLRLDTLLNFERILWKSGVERIAGVDEAGMAPLAGPVVAAAIVFKPHTKIAGVDDSKRLDPEQRETLAKAIRNSGAQIGVGVVQPDEIDKLNIYHAGLEAMRRAVHALPEPPEHILVDAREIPATTIPQNRFNRGDGLNFSIAGASIIAKTHRDQLMCELDKNYPGYGFAKHKGYPTREHQQACKRLGLSPVHRRSFPVIQEIMGAYSQLFYDLKQAIDATRDAKRLHKLDQRVETNKETLTKEEHKKLRLLLNRRWKVISN